MGDPGPSADVKNATPNPFMIHSNKDKTPSKKFNTKVGYSIFMATTSKAIKVPIAPTAIPNCVRRQYDTVVLLLVLSYIEDEQSLSRILAVAPITTS